MTFVQAACALAVVFSIVFGQLLFKLSSRHIEHKQGIFQLIQSFITWEFCLALVFYMSGTFLWVILLRTIELNKVYPFTALSFIILPVAAHYLFGESLGTQYLIGTAFFVFGLYLVVTA